MLSLKPTIFVMLIVALITSQAAALPRVQRDDADSYDAYETQYRWLEIEDIGSAVAGIGDNEFVGPFDIGFDFPYFGQNYNSFYISSNGFIGFGPTAAYQTAVYQSLPDPTRPNNIIAPLWKNFNPEIFWGDAIIYYANREGCLVVEFQRYPEVAQEGHSPDNTITMQVILQPDGDILFEYQNVGESFDLSHGVVGVEGPDGEDGITIRYDGDGAEITSRTAFLISEHGPGNFLIWDAGSRTTSGDEEENALRAGGYSTAHLRLRNNQPLPADLLEYEGVFVNLGNYGVDGRGYHQLTADEGRILASYLQSGGSLYLEGSDFWTRDPATAVHEFFRIEGIRDGRAAEAPVAGVAGSFTEGLRFDTYNSADNDFVDQLRALGTATPILTFHDGNETPVGMVAYNGRPYRTIGASFEFGALADGQNGTKAELADRIVTFFRSSPPDYFPPTNLHATVGDGEVALSWDYIERGRDQARRQELLHDIAALTPRYGVKPDVETQARLVEANRALEEFDQQPIPQRDGLDGFNIYLDGELYDFTNGHSYTVLELQNGQQYRLKVTAVYENPAGESEPTDEVIAVPTDLWRSPQNFDFEQFNGALAPYPVQNGWEWGTPQMGAASGQKAWGTRLGRNYEDNADYILQTPIINLEGQPRAAITFNHFISCEGGWDGGRLEISRDYGERWDILTPLGGYPDQGVDALNSGPGYTGSNGGWRAAECDLTPYVGDRVIVRFRFKSDESEHNLPGWFIDDLRLYTPQIANLNVRVVDSNNGNAISGASVALGNRFQLTTDADGYARFAGIPAGNYHINATKKFYQSGERDIDLPENQNINASIGINLYPSELRLPNDGVAEVELESGEQASQRVSLSNQGALVTDFQVYLDFDGGGARAADEEYGEDNDEPRRDNPWELFKTVNLSDATNNQYIVGADMVKSGAPRAYSYFVSGGGFDQPSPRFHRLDRDFGLVTTIAQGINDPEGWGVRDFAYDGVRLYGSPNNRIYPIDPANGAFLGQVCATPLSVVRAITFVPGENAFWVGDRDNTWYKIANVAEGTVLDRWPQHGLTGVVGMAWNPSDPDGNYLYVHNQEPNGGAALYRFNPATRNLVRQMTTAEPGEGTAGGAFVTYLYDTQNWVLGVVIQGVNGDKLKLYELYPRRTWVRVTPSKGQLDGGASTDLTIAYNATGRVNSDLHAALIVQDLRNGSQTTIDLSLRVNGDPATVDGGVTLDARGDTANVAIYLNNVLTAPVAGQNEGEFSYSYNNLLPGRYKLRAELAGFHPFASDSFDLAANQELHMPIRLTHLDRGVISGAVTNVGGGLPMEGVEIAAVLQSDHVTSIVGLSDQNGAYSLNVPAGTYKVTARKLGYRTVSSDDIVVADGDNDVVNFETDDRMPVHALKADGDWDDRVVLTWARPGTYADEVQLRIDNGVAANGIYLRGHDDIFATRYEPDGIFDILNIAVVFATNWPPDNRLNNIELSVWNEDPETGLPDSLIWTGLFVANRGAGLATTARINSLRFLEGPFFIGIKQPLNQARPNDYDGISVDNNVDFPSSTYLNLDGVWRRFDGLPGDQFVRALIWSYNDQEERNLAPHPIPPVDQIDGANAGVTITALTADQMPALDLQIAPNEFVPEVKNPTRDAPLAYKVIVDGEVAIADLQTLTWSHIDSTIFEDQLHTYQVVAAYADGHEEPSPEIEAKHNWPPDTLRAPTIVYNGTEYTLRWAIPVFNVLRRDSCRDYAGTQIRLNGELVATVEGRTNTYTGQMAEGSEGIYTVSINGFDEVPNYGPTRTVTFPIGLGQILDFEVNRPTFFTVSPANSWIRDDAFPTPPGRGHNLSSFAFATRPAQGRYDDNVNYLATTTAEYYVSSPTARVEFYHFYSTENGHDGGRMLVSVDNGPFQVLEPENGYPDQTVAAFENGPAFTGDIGDWQLVTADLSQFRGHNIKLRFHFASDDEISWYPGWYIDDLCIWGVSTPSFGQIYGTVTDQNQNLVGGVSLSSGTVRATSDQNGFYRLQGLLPGQIQIAASKAGYMPTSHQMDIATRDSIQVNLELYHPVAAVDSNAFHYQIGGNDQIETHFTISNGGQHPIPFNVQLLGMDDRRDNNSRSVRSLDGRNVKRDRPGLKQFDFDATTITGQRRIMGAEYAEDKFFLTSADPDRGLLVTVLNHDGAVVRTFAQPQGRRVGWGLRDLAYDGEFLYGSQNDSIYCFTTQGVYRSQQLGAPLTINRALAYDENRDAFWAAEWDSPWYLVNRQGQVVISWEGHGLKGVYGLAYHPADAENMPLYALNLEDDGSTAIYKANPETGEIVRVFDLDGAPTGCFLTGQWDANRWILGAVTGTSSQRLVGIELSQRISWIGLSPSEGEIDAGESQQIDVSFLVPPDATQGDNYSANISIQAFGAQLAVVQASVEIVAGFRHFDEPVPSEQHMTVNVTSAQIFGRDIPLGSEVALITPRNDVGGVVRWEEAPEEILAYIGENLFAVGDSIKIFIWDAARNTEFIPEVVYTDGQPVCSINGQATVQLTVREPDRQTVLLGQGWSLMSSYITPMSLEAPDIFADLLVRDRITLVKDGAGRFWAPRRQFNGLGQWNSLRGYYVFVTEADSVIFEGERIPANSPISLTAGWNQIGYLLSGAVNSQVGFETILDDVVIAKNGRGEFLSPRYGFYGLRTLQPGEGYKVNVTRAVDLVYHGANRLAFETPLGENELDQLPSTGFDMSLLILNLPVESFGDDDFVEVYAGNYSRVVGRAKVHQLPVGLAIRGDDSMTAAVDGALEGEKLTVKLIRNGQIIGTMPGDVTLAYATDGFMAMSLESSRIELPTEVTLTDAFPNPFNGTTTIRYGLPNAGIRRMTVLDLNGRLMWDSGNEMVSAGWYSASINAGAWPSGIYIAKLEAVGISKTTKLVLVR